MVFIILRKTKEATMKYTVETILDRFDSNDNLNFLFFWGHTENKDYVTKACLSQWYESEFKENEITYFTTEHYMMAEKAKLFDDINIYNQILETRKQGKIKELGRQIKNFNQSIWDQHKYEIVLKGNFLKFSQNKKLKIFLLNTKNKILVEASPLDTIWGIGLSADDEKVNNPHLWEGTNLLGFALMEVRDKF